MADTYPVSTDTMPILNRVNTPAPTPAPAMPAPDSGDASAAVQQVAGAPSAAPVPTPGQNVNLTADKQSKVGAIFQDIAGGKTTDYVQTPKGPVPVKRNLQPGEMARNILASAFSLLSAGAGGDLAAREKRPYVQPEEQTIGGMEKARVQGREQQANQVYENQRQATTDTLAAQKAALDQQEAIGRIQTAANQNRSFQVEYQNAVDERGQRMQGAARQQYDQLVNDSTYWNQYMAEPGASVMKDANGQPLAFFDQGHPGDPNYVSAGQQLQKYATQHPEVLHGRTDGKTGNKYGVIPAINPATGAVQLIDLPADRNDKGLVTVGQKHDANGNPVFDKAGNPVPDGTILDPVTHKPTVLSETVSAAQVGDIRSKQITQADTEAQLRERDAIANFRDAQIKALPELNDALSVYNTKGVGTLSAKQRTAVSAMYGREFTIANQRLNEATTALAKARQIGESDDDPTVKTAIDDFNSAQNDYNDIKGKYDELTGLSSGVKVANDIIRKTDFNKVNWPDIDKQIAAASGLTPEEQQAARAKVWNALSPAQQAAARGNTNQQTNAQTKPSPTKQTVVNGKTLDVVYDSSNVAHGIPQGTADEFIADPAHKGWHK